jgi:elongator complex protein 3
MQEALLCQEIIQRLIATENINKKDLNTIKIKVSGKYKVSAPSNSIIIKYLKPEERKKLLPLLKRKTVRSISGIVAVAVMTAPYPCPKNSPCAYCPGGPDFAVPQSYTGFEPATMRGLQNNFDPHAQVRSRIGQLEAIGHTVDKVELIIMGGTFPATPLNYQEHFVQRCLDAITCIQSKSLDEAKTNAESSLIRNVGITVETRPDRANEEDIGHMLSMGVTRVELGVQTVFDDIYELVNRGHRVEDVIEATCALKDSGLKVCYHMMPGLPGSNFEKDLDAFRRIFEDPGFKPDMIKIYPCLVIKGTKVYDWWLEGKYEPYTTEEATELIAQVKKMIPSWVRVMRIQRDIPAGLIMAGVKKSNLRELVLQKLKDEGSTCQCIRCREVGHRIIKDNVSPDLERIRFSKLEYKASDGKEFFISIEDRLNDVLIGYLRLRAPSEKAHRPEIGPDTSIVRELHVYGDVVPVGKHVAEAWQHKGCGALLLSEAEKTSLEELGREKIVITSALGTKQYYKGFGYDYDGPYVSKHLKN